MSKAFGIINFARNDVHVSGMLDYRPIGAFSFLGRYRVIDFPISNMSNSGIDVMQVYVRRKPRSLVEHLGTGRHYNINSKRGKLNILFAETIEENNVYNTDIAAYIENLDCFDEIDSEYVILAPSYMVYTADYNTFLQTHIESGADITLMYFDNSDDSTNCDYDGVYLKTDEDDKVLDMCYSEGKHRSNKKSMDAYIMKTTLLIDFIETAIAHNKKHFFFDVIVPNFDRLVIQGYEYKGYVGCITSLEAYYNVNMDMLKPDVYKELFLGNRRIYTKSADGAPAKYGPNAKVSNSLISSGCEIDGEVENSVIFRGSQIAEGAVIKNSVVMAEGFIAPQAEINHTILDRHVKVYSNAHLSGSSNHPVFIPKGASVNE